MNNKFVFIKDRSNYRKDEILLDETLFHNANGYIGVRGSLEEGTLDKTIRGTYINGVYDIVPMEQAEPLYGLVSEKQTIVNLLDSQDVKLFVDGELCSINTGKVVSHIRTLDMEKGRTERLFIWENSNQKRIIVKVERLASFSDPNLFYMNYSLESCDEVSIEIRTSHSADVSNFFDPTDPRVAAVSHKHVFVNEIKYFKTLKYSEIKTRINKSEILVNSYVMESIDIPCEVKIEEKESSIGRTYNFKLKGKAILERRIVLTDSRNYQQYQQLLVLGKEEICKKQEMYLKKFWDRLSLSIDGDDDVQKALYFNLYQLLQSVGRDGFSHLAAKGLSGEGYEGHYFWDTEMYSQPFFTTLFPDLSKELINYRYTTLKQAKDNARILGHKRGALYPWRTINGVECSGYFPSGTAQYHINSAVAHSIMTYYRVTKDEEFMAEKGLEILLEIALLWIDFGTFKDGKFNINCVTGPDEYTCVVNNNFYTNINAKHNLQDAYNTYKEFEEKGLHKKAKDNTKITDMDLKVFYDAAKEMFLPYDKDLDITPQDDSFLTKKMFDIKSEPRENFPLLLHYHPLFLYRYQVCKQADTLLAHFLFEDEIPYSTRNNSYDYYKAITTHDSSLSKCIFSIVATRLGRVEEGYDLYEDSLYIDMKNTHNNTKDGLHTANLGGSYLAFLFGFAGLKIKDDEFHLNPVLPKKWRSYSFNLMLRNNLINIRVDEKESIVKLIKKGDDLTLFLNNKKINL